MEKDFFNHMNQKGFIKIILVVIIVGVVGYFVLIKKTVLAPTQTQSVNTPPTTQNETINWKVFDSVKDGGWKDNFHFTVKYPPSWYERTSAGGTHVGTEIADYDVNNVNKIVPVEGQLEVSQDAPIPTENCKVSFFAGLGSKDPGFLTENTYTQKDKHEACEKNLSIIKSNLDVSQFVPFSEEELKSFEESFP